MGDTVNLSQRLQQLADSGETVLSQAIDGRLLAAVGGGEELLPEQLVKGRDTPVRAWRIAARVPAAVVLADTEGGSDGSPTTSGGM